MALAVNRALVGDTQHWLFCLNHPELHFAPTPLSHWQETMAPLHRSTGRANNIEVLQQTHPGWLLKASGCVLLSSLLRMHVLSFAENSADLEQGFKWGMGGSSKGDLGSRWFHVVPGGSRWIQVVPVKGIQVWSLRKRYLQAKSSSIKHKRMHSARSSMLFTCNKDIVVFRQICFWKLQMFYFYFLTVLWSKPSKWPPTTLSTALKMIVIYFYSLFFFSFLKTF